MLNIQDTIDYLSKNKFIVFLFLMFTIIVFTTSATLYHKYLKNYEYKITITLDNKTTTNNKMAIMFYSFDAKFSRNNSISSNHIDNEIIFQKIFYNSLKNIRFDIVNAKEDFYIKNITVSFNGKEKIINYNQIMEYFNFKNVEPKLENDSLLCVSLNHDPMIIAKHNFIKLLELKSNNSIRYILKILAFDILILILFTAIIYYYGKKINKAVSFYIDKKTSKINLSIITIILSIVMAAILEYIFICIGNLPYKQINYSNINYFYLPRYLFFLIWTFTIFFVFYIGKENAIKFRYAIVLFLLFILTLGNYNLSSHTIYENFLLDKTEDYKPSVIVGSPKAIRVDEYFAEKPYYFAQALSSEFLPYYNNNLMIKEQDMVVSAFAPVNDIIMLAKPELWGYFFLPYDHAFAFYWWFKAFFFIMCIFEFFYYYTKRPKASLLAALIMYFSPPVQWWFSQNTSNTFPAILLAFVLFDRYLKNKTIVKNIAYLILLFFCIIIFIMVMYPAIQVPLIYFAVIFGIYILYSNKKTISKKHILGIIATLIPIALLILHFYTKSYVAIDDIANTVYPGSSRHWNIPNVIDQVSNYFFNYIIPYTLPKKSNQCELSQFYHFFIFFIIYLFLVYKNRKDMPKYIKPIVVSIGILTVVLFIGKVEIIKTTLFMHVTFPNRIIFIIQFLIMISVLLIILETNKNWQIKNKYTSAIISLSVVIIMYTFAFFNEGIHNKFMDHYVFKITFIFGLVIYGIYGYLFLTYNKNYHKYLLIMLFVLSFTSTMFVNPINIGVSSIYDKKVMADIVEKESNTTWIYNGNVRAYSILFTYAGVKHISGIYYYPDKILHSILDSEKKFSTVHNRFSFMQVDLVDQGKINYKLNWITNFKIELPYEYLYKLKVNYILSSTKITQDNMRKYNIELEKYYPLENLYLYKVNR